MIKGQGGAFAASTLVLFLVGGFLVYGLMLTRGPSGTRALFHATFTSANGLKAGDDVMLGGVNVGRVQSIHLNPQDALADVTFTVLDRLALPVDTVVAIGSSTMMDDNALQIEPGKSRQILKPGTTLTNTRPQLSLEQQISNYIFNTGKL